MLQVLSLMSKFVFSPVWLLWRFYGLLWWAFDGSPRTAAVPPERAPERGAAFEVVDSRPKEECLPRPVGLLRAGFAGSLVACGVFGVLSRGLLEAHALSEPRAVGIWAWASVVTMIGSIFAVRHVAAKRAAKRGIWWNTRRAVAGAAGKVRATVNGVRAVAADGVAAKVEAVRDGVAESAHVQRLAPVAKAVQEGAKKIGWFAMRAGRASVAGVKHAAATYKGQSPAAPATSA